MTTLDAVARDLEACLPEPVVRGSTFAELTTYRVGGPVAVVAQVDDPAELRALAAVVAEHRPPVLVVGRGSNLLVSDAGFEGLVVRLGAGFEEIEVGEHRIRTGGAVPLPVLARRAAAAGRTGLEFFVGIPGSVGGAVRMNAGGHGRETRQVLDRAWIVDLHGDGGSSSRPVEALDFGYRHSNVSSTEVVVEAEFVVTTEEPAACEVRVAEIVRWRREHQPGGANAGSVFRNPPGDSAGRIIDACGLKGLRVGAAVVSPKHANFFQAEPGASADDVARLVAEVQQRVLEATGVRLVPELQLVGAPPLGSPPSGTQPSERPR